MKHKWLTALCLSLISAGLFSCSTARVNQIMKRQITPILEDRAKSADILEDPQMHVVLVGSGGPMNNEDRLSACTAIIAGGEFILVDAGPGTSRNADLQNLPLMGLSAVFLTHYHSDHIGGLGETNFMSWGQARKRELDVYGPEGVRITSEGLNRAVIGTDPSAAAAASVQPSRLSRSSSPVAKKRFTVSEVTVKEVQNCPLRMLISFTRFISW